MPAMTISVAATMASEYGPAVVMLAIICSAINRPAVTASVIHRAINYIHRALHINGAGFGVNNAAWLIDPNV
jgi:putative Ca2+/H+ antiporter (TMEM165/GDT1 family)